MITLEVAHVISERIKNLELNYNVSTEKFSDGDFGDLREVDFSDGTLMGHVSIWSSGYVFYNLFNSELEEDYEIIKETHVDASGMSNEDLILLLGVLFDKMRK